MPLAVRSTLQESLLALAERPALAGSDPVCRLAGFCHCVVTVVCALAASVWPRLHFVMTGRPGLEY